MRFKVGDTIYHVKHPRILFKLIEVNQDQYTGIRSDSGGAPISYPSDWINRNFRLLTPLEALL